MNTELAETVTALDGVLAATLDVDNYFDLDQLYRPAHPGGWRSPNHHRSKRPSCPRRPEACLA